MGGLHFLLGSAVEGTKAKSRGLIFKNGEADPTIVLASTPYYNYYSPLKSYRRKASGTVLEPVAPFRRAPESPRSLRIHIFDDWQRCALKGPASLSPGSLVHSLIRLTLGANAIPRPP